MTDLLSRPWPWYIAGPVIGLMVPALLIIGNKAFGLSSSLRHICAACVPGRIEFFRYDWKNERWSLVLVAGIIVGGILGGIVFPNPNPIHPMEIFNFQSLLTLKGFLLIVVGGFLVGFGTRYAGGCTSGHSIMGMSNLQWPSLIATGCFFAGGLAMTWLILPRILALP